MASDSLAPILLDLWNSIYYVSFKTILYTIIISLRFLVGPIISDIRNNTFIALRLGDGDNIELFANEGDSLIWLSFNVEANPPITSNDVYIISSAAPYPNVNVTGSNVKLSFSNVRQTNAGMYEVTVKNTVGNSTLTFQLVVFCELYFILHAIILLFCPFFSWAKILLS